MGEVTVRLGKNDIKVNIDESQALFSAQSKIENSIKPDTTYIDTTICDIPEAPENIVKVPNIPVVDIPAVTVPAEIPKTLLAALLPCSEEGLFPCPDVVVRNGGTASSSAAHSNPDISADIYFGDPSTTPLKGRLGIKFDFVSKCCCDAENGTDTIEFTPGIYWSPPSCSTDTKRIVTGVSVVNGKIRITYYTAYFKCGVLDHTTGPSTEDSDICLGTTYDINVITDIVINNSYQMALEYYTYKFECGVYKSRSGPSYYVPTCAQTVTTQNVITAIVLNGDYIQYTYYINTYSCGFRTRVQGPYTDQIGPLQTQVPTTTKQVITGLTLNGCTLTPTYETITVIDNA